MRRHGDHHTKRKRMKKRMKGNKAMKQEFRKRGFPAVLAVVLILLMIMSSCGSSKDDPVSMRDQVAKALYSQSKEAKTGAVGGDWTVIALSKSGIETEKDYYDRYYDSVCEYVKKMKGDLSSTKYTEYARLSIAASCIGKDPTDVAGYDLMKPAKDLDFVKKQGINGPAFALIAANMAGYEPVLDSSDKYIDYILSQEIKGGGFALEGPEGSPYIDITAMTVQALSYYKDDAKVKKVIDRAVDVMADLQQEGGGYDSSESISQTIIALTAAGIDPLTDQRFITDGRTLVDALAGYMTDDDMFAHEEGSDSDMMATEQALCALDAVALADEGRMLYEAAGN